MGSLSYQRLQDVWETSSYRDSVAKQKVSAADGTCTIFTSPLGYKVSELLIMWR